MINENQQKETWKREQRFGATHFQVSIHLKPAHYMVSIMLDSENYNPCSFLAMERCMKKNACLFLILGKIKLNMKNSFQTIQKKREKQLTVAILITTHVVQFYSRIYNSLLCCLMQKFGKSLQDKILSSPFTFSLEHSDTSSFL